ncbi:MAG: hypothetical protein IJ799_03535, partial [Bacteroidales bacterium]|nr:hypothetical protein [Bacteroidales bacterium]
NRKQIGEEELESSFGLDLRSKLIGKFAGLDVIEHHGQPLVSTSNIASPWFASGATTFISKGWSSISCFVDGIPTPFQEFLLDPNQIESVEFVTDVADKGELSPLANTGAIYITTKKGAYNTPMRIKASVQSGINIVDKMPEWVDGVTYARLNNLARGASGYTPLYSEEAIEGYAQNDPLSLTTPNVDYKSLLIRNWKPTTTVGFSVDGGTSNIKYIVAMNGIRDGDIFKLGPVCAYNKLNLTTSITAKIGRWIEARASFLGLVSVNQGNRVGLFDYRSVPAIAFPAALGKSLGQTDLDNDKAGTMIYAVSRNFTSNPYAAANETGFSSILTRSGMFNADLGIDLGWLLKGLKAKTLINFGSFYMLGSAKVKDYIAYYWDANDGIVDLSGHVGTKNSGKSSTSNASYQTLNWQQDLSYGTVFGKNKLDVRARYYISNAARSGNSNYEKMQTASLFFDYCYDGRLAANFNLQYAGATPFAPKVRYALFPTAGVSWLVSNEKFMQDVRWLERFRLWAQAGHSGYADVFTTNYLYQGDYNFSSSLTFGPATAYQWFGSDKQSPKYTVINRLANPELTWPKTDEFDLGADLSFPGGFDLRLKGYLIYRNGLFTNTMSEYISAYGMTGITYYENYNAKRTAGGEISLGWNRSFGDFKAGAELWATSWRTVNTKVANDFYIFDWQKATGRDENAITGYVQIGRFETQEQIDNCAKIEESGTRIGDLMYKDLDGDGVINNNDVKVIGNTNPWLRYSLNLFFSYKDFALTMTGTGHAFYDQMLTSGYFWSGWGDGNYTKFVADNIGGAYPRLSYERSSTNFVNSNFWMRRGGYFKLKSVQLSYDWKPGVKWIENVRFTLTGGNLLTLTGLEYVDPEDIAAGVSSYPFYRNFLAGVKLTF